MTSAVRTGQRASLNLTRPAERLRAVILCRPVIVVGQRVATAVPLLLLVSMLTFALESLAPGDTAHLILGPLAPASAYVGLRRQLSLDRPLYDQYWNWLTHALRGNLGDSVYGQSVTRLIDDRISVTLSLIGGALLVTLVVGVLLGITSAVQGGVVGRVVDAFSLVAFATPAFWLGSVLIVIFSVHLGWLPATGYVSITVSPADWIKSIALPVVALSFGSLAAVAKQTREAMSEALSSEYIKIAWANGISPLSIYFRHALKVASLRVITVMGVQAIGLLGGSVVIESVFALPGVGSLLVDRSIRHDLPVVQGIVVYFTILVVVINLLIDLAYTWLNPKVRI